MLLRTTRKTLINTRGNLERLKDSRKHSSTKSIKRLQAKRNNYISDYIHKTSYKVVELALDNKCNTIVLGDLKDIKHKSKMKSFVQIPIGILVRQIKYKAKVKGKRCKKEKIKCVQL